MDRARSAVQAAPEDHVHRRAPRAGTPTTWRASARCSTRCRTSAREVGAVLYDLGRQPRAAHDFLVKCQDRVAVRQGQLSARRVPTYWRVFETADEYFDYYRDYHAFWKLA